MKSILACLLLIVFVGCGDKPNDKLNDTPISKPNEKVEGNSGETRLLAGDGAIANISKVAKNYKSLQLMTPKPVFVNPELARLCWGASKEMVLSARKEKGPHAHASISIYMNSVAANAFAKELGYPTGSVIVKEKGFHRNRHGNEDDWVENGVGGMIKRSKGYDAENGDWEYFYFESASQIESGRIASCVECHSKAADTDYVFGSWKDE